ncbi:MAG: helix-turn-helix domain-containing protein [Planctomycetaceae bacterium]|nr:helix-turn-helix domain-containing protein [Planctomycetaceae bacterium]
MRRAFKFRLYPNANQERDLETMREAHRRLYNACLDERKMAHEAEKRTVRYTEQSAKFTEARKTNPFYANLTFSSAQATMRRLDKASKAFFARAKQKMGKPGSPRFKGRDRFDSVEFPAYGDGVRLNGTRLRVQAVRNEVMVVLHREVEGKIETVTLKREADR